MRDDFSIDLKRTIAHRVGLRCSRPECRASTTGPTLDESKALNIGVAAHIYAASPGGARYASQMSSAERSHASNAIWLCQNYAKLVDNDERRFTTRLLQKWKNDAETEALSAIGKAASSLSDHANNLTAEEIEILCAAAQDGEIRVIEVNEFDPWVDVAGERLLDESDPAFAALYLESLRNLIKRGLVIPSGGILYGLTGTGFRVARELKDARVQYQEENSEDELIYSGIAKIGVDKHLSVEFTIENGNGVSYRIDSDDSINVMILSWGEYKEWINSFDEIDPMIYAEHLGKRIVEEQFWTDDSDKYALVIMNASDQKIRVAANVEYLTADE